jgi:hypothetical protein
MQLTAARAILCAAAADACRWADFGQVETMIKEA